MVTGIPAVFAVDANTTRTDIITTQADSYSTKAFVPHVDNTSTTNSSSISSSYIITSVSSQQEIASISHNVLSSQASSNQTRALQIETFVSSTSMTPGIHKDIIAQPSTHTISGNVLQPYTQKPIIIIPASPSIHMISGNIILPNEELLINSMPIQPSTHTIMSTEPRIFKQNIIPNDVLTVVYDYELEHDELVISNNETSLSRIVVTEDTDEPKLNLKNLIDEDGTENQNVTLTYPNTLAMDVVTNGVEASLLIETETEITGFSEWDGVINLPIFVETDRIKYTDPTRNVTSVLTVGLDNNMLKFNKPVSIIFKDKAGQEIGFHSDNSITIIDTICDDNDLDTVSTQLRGDGECRIDVDQDLLVWTFHFTDFFTTAEMERSDDTDVVTEPDPLLPDIPTIPDMMPDPISNTVPDMVPDVVPNIPHNEPRYGPHTSSGGGGGGGGGGGSGIFRGDSGSGLSAVLDITSDGRNILDGFAESIHLEPGSELVITPVIVPDDYTSNILRMDVLFHTGASPEPVAWIQYSALPNLFSGQMCAMPLLEFDQVHTCDTISLISGAGPSYTMRPDSERAVLQNLVIPFGPEFSGSMSVSILDSHGIELLGYDDATYHLNIAEYVETGPAVEPEVPPNVIGPESVDPEPVNVNPGPTKADPAPADPEPDPTPPPPPAPAPTTQTSGTDAPPAGADHIPEDEDQFEFITEFGNNLMNFMNGLTHILFGGRP